MAYNPLQLFNSETGAPVSQDAGGYTYNAITFPSGNSCTTLSSGSTAIFPWTSPFTIDFTNADNLTQIESAFLGASGLTGTIDLTGCKNLAIIGDAAFQGCTSLTSVIIPTTVTLIGQVTFSEAGLTSISIPASVTLISEGAFNQCTNLTTVTFAQNSALSIIRNYAFADTGLTSISIPASVTLISDGAFNQCTNLTTVTFDQGSMLYTIGINAFADTGLTSISIPASVDTISFEGFARCPNLTTVTFDQNSQLSTIQGSAFTQTSLTSITIPASVTIIQSAAFNNITSLTTVEILGIIDPPPVGANIFEGCPIVTATICGENPLNYYSFETANLKHVTINNRSTTVTEYFATYNGGSFIYDNLETVTIGSNVTSIGDSAFKGCTGLTSITVPSSVTTIGTDSFKGCSNVTSLIINSPTVLINGGAFADCTKLTNVEISGIATNVPRTVAFYDAAGIKILSLNGSTRLIEFRFNPSLSLTNLTVTGTTGYTTVSSRFTDGYKNTPIDMLTIEDGVITVASAAFQGCTGIKNLKIMPSIATIGAYAFSGCTGITSIDFDPPVDLTIADHAFEGNTSLTTLLLPEYVISIGDYSFANCTNLTTITIQNPNMFIGTNAFAGCTSLKTVNYCGPYTFGPGVTVICTSATLGSGATRGSSLTATANPVCFVKGTRILTMDGYVPIEKLKLNASLISKGRIVNGNFRADPNGCVAKKLKGIGNFKVDGNKKKNAPICIKKNAFFHNYPSRDLYVSADHGIIVGTKNVQAKDLINDDTIYRCSEFGEVEYFHVELDHHSAIIAENTPTESYLDVGNRNIFENWISVRQISKIGNIHSLRR